MVVVSDEVDDEVDEDDDKIFVSVIIVVDASIVVNVTIFVDVMILSLGHDATVPLAIPLGLI